MDSETINKIIDEKKRVLKNLNLKEGKDRKKAVPGSFISRIDPKKVNIIAEIKRASPSKGIINKELDITDTVRTYSLFKSFISGISVLTEELFFKGSIKDLAPVKQNSDLPVLRKDFIISERQIDESISAGADCILLISGILGKKRLKELYGYAVEAGIDVLLESYKKEEFLNAIDLGASFIGINNRDLFDLKVDNSHAISVLKHIDPRDLEDRKVICESGIYDAGYIQRLFSMGVSSFLIGTYFMQSKNMKKDLLGLGQELTKRRLI